VTTRRPTNKPLRTPPPARRAHVPQAGIATKYLDGLRGVLTQIEVTGPGGKPETIDTGIDRLVGLVTALRQSRKVQFIGNGGSATLASHGALDWWKNGGVRAVAYNDPANLTAVSNDFSFEQVFEIQVERFADKGDLLVAISSSGRSKNILNGVAAARQAGCAVCTMSGFASSNPLRHLGDLNFYVPSNSYGFVEVSHSALLHCVMSILVSRRLGTPIDRWA
jgi:D-sedoheptulose 7-phosphate isomerase